MSILGAGMANFFAELKRRNVYKVAITYAVVAWLLIQAASILLPTFEAPNWVMKAFVLFLAFGFVISVMISWAFEATPEGLKRTEDVPPDVAAKLPTWSRRKFATFIIVVALLAVGLLAYQFLRPKTTGTLKHESTAVRTEAATVIPNKSIAVLPFENLSDDKSNAYFAEGIQNEILTRLSKIAALKVISRSSTQRYKSAPDNLREVGNQLGVAHLLEGSVQKIGNAVHINVQLIHAATDAHLWAESYDRKLDDVFGVEGEVARAIADQLNAKLTGAEQTAVVTKLTENAAAYDAYLRGQSLEHSEYNYDAGRQAARDYVEAARLDPKFAAAWARLCVVRGWLYFNGVDLDVNTPDAVKECAERAMAIAPEAGESWLAEGTYRYRVLRKFESALAAFDEARKRLPNDATVFRYIGVVQRRVGRWQESEANYKKALELDPRDVTLLNDMGTTFYAYLRRFDDAHALVDAALRITSDSAGERATKAGLFQAEGRLEEAGRELARIPEDALDDWIVSTRVQQAIYERHYDNAIKVIEAKLNSIPAGEPSDFYAKQSLVLLGFCQAWAGRPVEARNAFTRAVQAIKPTSDTVVTLDVNGTPMVLALAYAGLGEKEKALEQAQQALKDYADDQVSTPQAESTLAQVRAHFGDNDAAIAALPHLLEVPAGLTTSNLKFDPLWDPLRKDPRFEKLYQEQAQ